MASATNITRYRPAVLAVTGIAAACGVYMLCSTYSGQPEKSALQRSNAVHRPRDRIELETRGGNGYPIVDLVIRRGGGRIMFVSLATSSLPTMDEIRAHVGRISEDEYHEIASTGLAIVLDGCMKVDSPEALERLDRYSGLPEAIAARDDDDIKACSATLAASFPGVDKGIVDEAIEDFLSSPTYAAADATESELNATDLAETEDLDVEDDAPREPSQGIKGLLFYIAEESARSKAYHHRGIKCEGCSESPIRGIRWHCLNCPDFDLCSTCEAQSVHPKTHVFAKISIPLPVLSQPIMEHPSWYAGDPNKWHPALDAGVKKRMSQQYGFDEPGIDALYDQFTCTANVPWNADPTKVQAAIDRRAFNKALTSERWPQRFAPNAMYDCMFAFYDQDGNGLIGFEEFVSGMAYIRGHKRFTPLRLALEGFDIDGDGFLDRKDFLRLFRAKYVINSQLVADMVESGESSQTVAAMDVLRSSQPISSVFHEEEIPLGEDRPRTGKEFDAFGDLQPLPGTKTILDDDVAWPRSADGRTRSGRNISRSAASSERLRHHLSRFEEMLTGPVDSDESQSSPQMIATSDSRHERPAVLHSTRDLDNSSPIAGKRTAQCDDEDQPLDADVLWQVVDDGFNDMLDPVFKAKETEHNDAVDTRGERKRWRAEIENMLAEKRAFEEELLSAALVDPLMATAMKSYSTIKVDRKQENERQQPAQQRPEPAFRGDIVPTDADSLSRREQAIAERPLEELLDATGYGTIETTGQTNTETSETQHDESQEHKHPDLSLTMAGSTEASSDPMLPQNRLNELLPSEDTLDQPASAKSDLAHQSSSMPPSKRRLEYLASLDDVEREIEDRRGVGRLSFDEIEVMVHADTTKQLRGLVTSWLEWASF